MKKLLSVAVLLLALVSPAMAASTINPNIPTFGSALSSGPIQQNFAAAYNDVSNILGMYAGTTAPINPINGQDWLNTTTMTAAVWAKYDSTTQTWITVGTFNLTAGTLSLSACSTCANTNVVNTFTMLQKINLNAASLPSAQSGTVLQMGQADSVINGAELDSFSAASRWTCVREDGTAASPTAIQLGDEICSLHAFGYNGSAIVGPRATIRTYAAQNWTTGANGTYIRFGTTPNGSTTLADALSIEQDGGVTLGTVIGTSEGAGTINLSGGVYKLGVAATVTINTVPCPVWGSCTISATAGSITVGTTTIASGTSLGIFYDNAGVLGNTNSANNAVLVTSGIGAPSLATTLPSGITLPAPVVTTSLTYGGVTLSNSVSGTGSMVLATSPTLSNPTFSGTVAGNFSLSGNLTFSGTSAHTGVFATTATSAPASAAGQTIVMGTIAAPVLANNGQSWLYNTTANGAILQGQGSTYDVSLADNAGNPALGVPTGTTTVKLLGGITATGLSSGTCSSGIALNATNQFVLDACPGAASSIQAGAGGTTITSGTNGGLLWDSAGTLFASSAITALVLGNGTSAPSAYSGCTVVSNEWISALTGSGGCTQSQPSFANISGTISPSQLGGLGAITNTVVGNISLNNTSTFFDGPSIAQGTSGQWWACGTVEVDDTSAAAAFSVKLWDGTTAISQITTQTPGTSVVNTVSLCGYMASPAGNIRISVKDSTSTNGLIISNSNISAHRIN